MNNCNTVGLDVHKKMIVAAILPWGSGRTAEKVRFENHPKAIEKFVTRVASRGPLEFVYEAGPCGYEVHRQITGMGYRCVIIAPSLTPVRPGDRVKTDWRDAENLARFHRSGDLTEIRVPTREEKAARDLPRVREDALKDRLRARHRLSKFLLRQGRMHQETKAWGVTHRAWLRKQRFQWEPLQQTFEAYLRAVEETEARLETLNQHVQDLAQKDPYRLPVRYLSCLKGISTLSALTLLLEAQDFRRFPKASKFMSFTGLAGSEHTSADNVNRGSITKAGNAHIRRILVEASWSFRHRNVVSRELALRRKDCPKEVVQIARKAQTRLHRKFWKMSGRGKLPQKTVTAVARELAGFIWSIGQHFPEGAAA